MNCDEQFSQIFRSSLFEQESNIPSYRITNMKGLYFSEFKSSGFCFECHRLVEVKIDVF